MNDAALPRAESSLTGAPSLAISARGLVKTYGKTRAADGIDLDVPQGMIFAILGSNGAGKTTLMRMRITTRWSVPQGPTSVFAAACHCFRESPRVSW